MKNKLLIILISTICIFTIFMVEECIRLKVNKNSVPLIIFHNDEEYSEDPKQKEETYYSLGFKVEMDYYLDDKSSDDNYMYNIVGKEFHLFNVFVLWAWIV